MGMAQRSPKSCSFLEIPNSRCLDDRGVVSCFFSRWWDTNQPPRFSLISAYLYSYFGVIRAKRYGDLKWNATIFISTPGWILGDVAIFWLERRAVLSLVGFDNLTNPKNRTSIAYKNPSVEHNDTDRQQLILLMEEILHQLIDNFSDYLYTWFYRSQVVQDFFHQQYDSRKVFFFVWYMRL